MVLWLDAETGRYGLRAQSGYLETDVHAVDYDLGDRLKLEVGDPLNMAAGYRVAADYGNVVLSPMQVTMPDLSANHRYILFNPDGFVSQNSPERILLLDGENDPNPVVLLPAGNWQSYIISTNNLYALQR